MQIVRKKSDNTVRHIFKDSDVLTLDTGFTCVPSDGLYPVSIPEYNSTDYEIVKDVAKPANNRFYIGGLQTYESGTWSLDTAAVQKIRDDHAAVGRTWDEDQFNITWRIS